MFKVYLFIVHLSQLTMALQHTIV